MCVQLPEFIALLSRVTGKAIYCLGASTEEMTEWHLDGVRDVSVWDVRRKTVGLCVSIDRILV